jgi:hypothetical protein
MRAAALLIVSGLALPLPPAPTLAADRVTPNAKVFVHPMKDGFDPYFKAALEKKKVPIIVVASREEADYEIKGSSDTQKAGATKKIMLGSWHSDEQASISVAGIKSGEIVFAYSANKKNSARGKQTTAEACAKHLKEAIEKGK